MQGAKETIKEQAEKIEKLTGFKDGYIRIVAIETGEGVEYEDIIN